MLTAVALGFVLGLRHAFDPDHVAAVSTIASRHRNPWTAGWVGTCWGLGHTATILAVGFAIVALRLRIPESLGQVFELGVAGMLVVLGVANLVASGSARPQSPESGLALRTSLTRSGLVGLAHGLAGTAPVVLLATAAMATPAAALVYLAVFGLGTTLAMASFSLLVGAPVALSGGSPALQRLAVVATGWLSIACGAWLAYQVGFAERLAVPA
jgi:hypothetical protein